MFGKVIANGYKLIPFEEPLAGVVLLQHGNLWIVSYPANLFSQIETAPNRGQLPADASITGTFDLALSDVCTERCCVDVCGLLFPEDRENVQLQPGVDVPVRAPVLGL